MDKFPELVPGDRMPWGATILCVTPEETASKNEANVLWVQNGPNGRLEYGVHHAYLNEQGHHVYYSGDYFPATCADDCFRQFARAVAAFYAREGEFGMSTLGRALAVLPDPHGDLVKGMVNAGIVV